MYSKHTRNLALIDDPEAALYSGGFLSHANKVTCAAIRSVSIERLGSESLSEQEQLQWQDFRFNRFTDKSAGEVSRLNSTKLSLKPYLSSTNVMKKITFTW